MNPERDNQDAVSPADSSEAGLAESLRRLAAETHPRPPFKAALRAEVEQRAAARAAQQTPKPPHTSWWALNHARPWLAQGGLVLLLAALVFLAGRLAPLPLRAAPAQPEVWPAQPATGQNGLPVAALARLGRGTVRSLDAAEDGRLAVGTSAGVCVYNPGMLTDWCDWTATVVIDARFDPSGQYLAVALSPDLVQVRGAATGQVLAERVFAYELRPEQALSSFYVAGPILAWDPDPEPAQRLAVAVDGAISAWDWQADATAWGPVEMAGNISALRWVQISANQTMLAATDREGIVIVFPEDGNAVRRLDHWKDYGYQPWQYFAADLSAGGRKLVVGYPQGAVEISAGEQMAYDGAPTVLSLPYQPARLAYSPDGSRLAAISQQSLIIFNGDGSSQTYPASATSPLAWGAGGSLYYVLPDGALGKLQDGAIGTISSAYIPAQFLAWSGPAEITAAIWQSIAVWDARRGELSSVSRAAVEGEDHLDLAGLSADGSLALYAQGEGLLIVWDVASNRPLERLSIGEASAGRAWRAIGLSGDGQMVYTITRGATISVWDRYRGWDRLDVKDALPPDVQIDATAWQADGNLLAVSWSGTDDSPIVLWDMDAGRENGRIIALFGPVSRLAFSPDGALLAAAHGSKITVWEVATLERRHTLGPEILPGDDDQTRYDARQFTALAFSPDGRTLAAGGSGVSLWSLESGLPLGGFRGHALPVLDLAYRADGALLASASADGTILVWDTGAGSLGPPAAPEPTATPLPVEGNLPRLEPVAVGDGPLPLGLAVDAYRLDRPVIAEDMGFEQARAALGPNSRLARWPQGRSLWDTAVLALLETNNAALSPFEYRLETRQPGAWEARRFTLYQGDRAVLADLTGFHPVSLRADGGDFRLLVEDDIAGTIKVVQKDDISDFVTQEGSVPALSRPQFLGMEVVHATSSSDGSGQAALWTVQLWRGEEEFLRVVTQDYGVLMPVMGFWTYGDHWALETAGSILIDDVSVIKHYNYDEAFGFHLLGGQPLFFFRRGEQVGINFAGQEVALPWEEILHYNCCSGATLNPLQVGNVLLVLAQQGEQWYYAEIEAQDVDKSQPLDGR